MLPEVHTEIPGPRSRELSARLARTESRNVTTRSDEFPVFLEKGEGTNVWDVDGNRFLDLTAGFGVGAFGHGAPPIVEAARDQAATLVHAMGDVHPASVKVELCEALSRITFERWGAGTGKSILGNSGFEAVEAAMKTAFLATGRRRVITFSGGYHGLGYGTLMAGGIERFREPFAPQLGDLGVEVPFPPCGCEAPWRDGWAERPPCRCCASASAEAASRVESALESSDVGAVIVEPILGRGGKVVPAPGFLRCLRNLCDTHGALLVFDEILTGFNRTGRLFACEHSGVVPDLVCLGKGLTGGFPLSACVGRADLMDAAWPASDGEALHTSTFLGHPVGCRMALASIERHRDPAVAETVASKGRLFRRLLEAIASPHRGRVRGLGLMLGLTVHDAAGRPDGRLAAAIIPRALRDGIIVLSDGPGGHVLALTPPFSIEEDEMRFFAERLQEYLGSLPGSVS